MVIYKGDPNETHFLNVDLDIYSRSDLQPLVSAFGEKVDVLFLGREKRSYSAHLELAKVTKDADPAIRGFCALIQALPPAERELWNQAKVREFNIGVQAGVKPPAYELTLPAETVKAASDVGARIGVTIYGLEMLGPR